MEGLTRSRGFWWSLLTLASAIIVASFVLEALADFDHIGLWFTMLGAACTVIVSVQNLRRIRRTNTRS